MKVDITKADFVTCYELNEASPGNLDVQDAVSWPHTQDKTNLINTTFSNCSD